MTKLRKQRKRKRFRYNVNRKRLRNKILSTGKIACKEIDREWEDRHSVKTNLKSMGLSYNPNETLKIPKSYSDLQPKVSEWEEDIVNEPIMPSKPYVAENLETDAKHPRQRLLRLPNSQISWITYLLDKYGTDYKAMARDKKNYYQETWKQLRAKVLQFEKIPEQYSKYLEERGPPKVDEN